MYESVLHRGQETASLQQDVRMLLPAAQRSATIEVDVATTRVAPQNPMTDDGLVRIYDPARQAAEPARAAELAKRLPQYNQVVRIFTDDASAVAAIRTAAQKALRA